MRENTLKQRLCAGKAVFGAMCTSSPTVVEMLGCLGFDWILLDNEHAPLRMNTLHYGGHRRGLHRGRRNDYGLHGTAEDYAKDANRQTLVCPMLEEVEAIENLPQLVTVPGVDVAYLQTMRQAAANAGK